jgi:hypothetical protein
MTSPVTGSGSHPTWMARVSNLRWVEDPAVERRRTRFSHTRSCGWQHRIQQRDSMELEEDQPPRISEWLNLARCPAVTMAPIRQGPVELRSYLLESFARSPTVPREPAWATDVGEPAKADRGTVAGRGRQGLMTTVCLLKARAADTTVPSRSLDGGGDRQQRPVTGSAPARPGSACGRSAGVQD